MTVAARLLVVAGLKREAQLAVDSGATTVCSGGDVDLLARRLAAVDTREARAVISFGLAGGLDPALAPGDLALGASVVSGQARHETDVDLTGAIRRALETADLRCTVGPFAGVDAAVLTPAAKADLRERTGAIAVDMESHVAARFAAARGLPFAILRAIADPAARALPPLAAHALTPDGGIAYGRVLAGLARAPRQIGALAAAGRDSRTAFAVLGRAGRALSRL